MVFRHLIEKEPISDELAGYLSKRCLMHLIVPSDEWDNCCKYSLFLYMKRHQLKNQLAINCTNASLSSSHQNFIWVSKSEYQFKSDGSWRITYHVYIFKSRSALSQVIRETSVFEVMES